MPGPIHSLLAADHDRLDRHLHRALAGPELELAALDAFRHGLMRHIRDEGVLFSLVHKTGRSAEIPRLRWIRAGHDFFVMVLTNAPKRERLECLRTLLVPHNRVEEEPDGVYQACEAVLVDELDTLRERLATSHDPKLKPLPETDVSWPTPADTRSIAGRTLSDLVAWLRQPPALDEPPAHDMVNA